MINLNSMKKQSFLLLAILFVNTGYSQKSILPQINLSTVSKTLFKGLANEIDFSTFPITNKFSLQVDSGEIKIIDGKKYIVPKSTGKLSVKVTTELEDQKITQFFYFESIEPLNPQITFSKENGEIIILKNKMTKQEISQIAKIILSYPVNKISNEFELKSMNIVIIKSDCKMNEIESNSSRLEKDLNKILNQLTKGSYLIFKDILVFITDSNIEKTIENICIEIE
jgi:GldM C-terminal domain